jgi:hypothetical protein
MRTLSLFGLAALVTGMAHGQEVRLTDRNNAFLELGSYGRTVNTRMQLGTVSNPGTEFNLDGLFGTKSNILSFRADAGYRFGRRDRVGAAYYGLTSGRTLALTEDLTIEGVTVPAGTGVRTRISIQEFQLKWLRSFYKEPKTDAGFILGAHVLQTDLSVTNNLTDAGLISEALTLPLPMGGLYVDHYFSSLWKVSAEAMLLGLRWKGYVGQIVDARADVAYSVTDRFRLGLGYSSFKLYVRAEGSLLRGEATHEYYGPRLFASYSF